MRWLLALLLLTACAQEAVVPGSVPDVPDAAPEPAIDVAPATCRPDLMFSAAKDGREIGLVDLTVVDMGTYYRIATARVYGNASAWYMNDLTLEVSDVGSGLMDFNRKQVSIDPATDCFVQDVEFSIAVRNVSVKQVTLKLGQGQNRAGQILVTASGKVDLREYVR